MRRKDGQALLEFLFVHLLTLLAAFAAIEVARLLAFKNCLQMIAVEEAQRLSFSHLSLLRDRIVPARFGVFDNDDKTLRRKVADDIGFFLSHLETSLFSFDTAAINSQASLLHAVRHQPSVFIRFVNAPQERSLMPGEDLAPGVYLKVNVCLPVLFSGFFRFFSEAWEDRPLQVGSSVQTGDAEEEGSRTCLGQYSGHGKTMLPLFWFRVRAAAYSPWPAASHIFLSGYSHSETLFGLEQEQREDVQKFVETARLSDFFQQKELSR